jgi:hypothetical protein
MFANAINLVSNFSRPVNTIMRLYGNQKVIPGSATLFFVNEEGYAITCKHVAQMLGASEGVNNQYRQFLEEKSKGPQTRSHLRELEKKYNYKADSAIQIKVNFLDCVDHMTGFTWINHPTLDLAIIKFNGFNNILYKGCAKFIQHNSVIQQGMFMCRLGYPFPEFSNFAYNADKDDIEWTTTGLNQSPRFPIEGMITRFLASAPDKMYGIEMSTPGLRGQSGGPLFDAEGRIAGMQFSTKHLHLGFDMVDKEIQVNNRTQKVSDYSFLHLGQCIHADAIKVFLKQQNVTFYEA